MKKIKILSLFVALITLTSLLAVSCDEEYGDKNNFEPFVATAFDCFDTVTEFKAYFDEKEDFDKTWEEVHAILLEYHKLYDIYNTYPDMVNLATINNAEPDPETGHRTLKVDERIAELLDYGKDIYRRTNGNTNIAMGSLLSIWHEYHTEGKENPDKAALPSETELREAAKHMNMDSVEVDMETLTVTITDPLLKFDVGAIAKGFAAEKVIEHVARMNHHGVLLNVGGAISTIGQLPYGEKWVISLESPDKSGKSIHTFDDDPLPFDHMAVSGGYHRYYTVDGVNYGHIIDPDTLYPPTYFASVCVHSHLIGPADVDALSTAIFCMTEKEARELIEEENGLFHKGAFEVMWIYPDMTVSVTDGFYSMD